MVHTVWQHCLAMGTQQLVTITIIIYSYLDWEKMLITTIISVAYIFGMFAISQAKFYRWEGWSSDKVGHLSRVIRKECLTQNPLLQEPRVWQLSFLGKAPRPIPLAVVLQTRPRNLRWLDRNTGQSRPGDGAFVVEHVRPSSDRTMGPENLKTKLQKTKD